MKITNQLIIWASGHRLRNRSILVSICKHLPSNVLMKMKRRTEPNGCQVISSGIYARCWRKCLSVCQCLQGQHLLSEGLQLNPRCSCLSCKHRDRSLQERQRQNRSLSSLPNEGADCCPTTRARDSRKATPHSGSSDPRKNSAHIVQTKKYSLFPDSPLD